MSFSLKEILKDAHDIQQKLNQLELVQECFEHLHKNIRVIYGDKHVYGDALPEPDRIIIENAYWYRKLEGALK